MDEAEQHPDNSFLLLTLKSNESVSLYPAARSCPAGLCCCLTRCVVLRVLENRSPSTRLETKKKLQKTFLDFEHADGNEVVKRGTVLSNESCNQGREGFPHRSQPKHRN